MLSLFLGKELQHLLQVDVVQVVGAADSLHHPALRCDHVKGEEGRLGKLQESGSGTCRHRVIGHEGHFGFQDVAVKAAETHTEKEASYVCRDWKQCGHGPKNRAMRAGNDLFSRKQVRRLQETGNVNAMKHLGFSIQAQPDNSTRWTFRALQSPPLFLRAAAADSKSQESPAC